MSVDWHDIPMEAVEDYEDREAAEAHAMSLQEREQDIETAHLQALLEDMDREIGARVMNALRSCRQAGAPLDALATLAAQSGCYTQFEEEFLQ